MTEMTKTPIEREAGNAHRVVAPAMHLLVILAVVTFVIVAQSYAWDWPWRMFVSGILVAYWIGFREKVGFLRALSERAVKSDIAWAAISRVLGAARRARAAVAWFLTTRPFRLLVPLALPLTIILTVAMTYRLAAMPALIARDTVDFGLIQLAFSWLIGLGYGLIGIAAPVATLLLLLRRDQSSLATAMVLHLLGLLGVCLVLLQFLWGAGLGILDFVASDALSYHPLFAAPEPSTFVRPLIVLEALANFFALVLCSRRPVQRHYNAEPPAESGGEAGAAAEVR